MAEIISKEIDKYIKFKYKIPPLDDIESLEIENSKNNLLNLSNEKLEKTKESLFFVLNGILKTLDKHNNRIKLSEFYLGSIYRDLYFGLSHNGVSTTPDIRVDENSKISIEYLKTKVEKTKIDILASSNFIELIDTLEKMKEEITVANTVYI